jgi:ribonuclease P protein component
MLNKKSRLTTSQFARAFKNAKRFRVGDFTFLIANKKFSTPKFAVVVGKKISKIAVVRNRLRRQIYARIQEHLVEEITDKNIICLYNGPKILENSTDFIEVAKSLLKFLNKS